MRILGISGSLRSASYNSALIRAAAEELPPEVGFETFDGLGLLPAYDEDADGVAAPPSVRRLRAAIGDADALFIATPEYNGSIPGGLKNALDWASRPRVDSVMKNKPVAVVGSSTGMFGAMWAQADLRRVLGLTGARVVGEEVPIARVQDLVVDGELADDDTRRLIAAQLEKLIAETVPAEAAA